MAKVIVALTMSLDGFIAGANDGPEQGLGEGGMRLFDWYFDGDSPIPQTRRPRRGACPYRPSNSTRPARRCSRS
ncbi:MAG: hypothetical protein ACYCSR_10505 [Thiomonas sp.]